MNELWFGTVQKFQWVPMPATIQRRNVSSVESGTLENGGGFVSRSTGRHSVFDFNFSTREAHGVGGLDVFTDYASGVFNDYTTVVSGFNRNDLVWFVDPMNAEQNLFAPHWAAPMLGLGGWPWIGSYVSNAAVAANTYLHPARTVTFNVTHAASTLPVETGRRFVIPIPPGYTLRWGWSGSATGTGAIRAEMHNASTGAMVSSHPAPLSVTALTRLNASIDGDTYDYATFGIARTSSAASTVTVASMLAVLHPNTETPPLTGTHIRGAGASGCVFDGDVIPEEYYLVHEAQATHLKGLSFGLKEIGAWL